MRAVYFRNPGHRSQSMYKASYPVLLITKLDVYPTDYSANAVLVENQRSVDFHIDRWSAWILDKSKKQVICKHFFPEWIGSGIDNRGGHVTLHGDARFLLDGSKEEAKNVFENNVRIIVEGPISNIGL